MRENEAKGGVVKTNLTTVGAGVALRKAWVTRSPLTPNIKTLLGI